jgi:hypothetical protein
MANCKKGKLMPAASTWAASRDTDRDANGASPFDFVFITFTHPS